MPVAVPRAGARPRVVVVGCGFGGLEAVRTLSPHDVEIVLVDRTNHHLFQPLLYQVATAGLAAPAIGAPIRHVLRREMRRGNLTVLKGEVCRVDVALREVELADRSRIAWDHLIVAAGATHSWFGHDAEWAPHAPGLKTLADAFRIRGRMLDAFEQAELGHGDADPTPPDPACLTFVVIGGGPTGVEMAGTVSEIARQTMRGEFRRIDPAHARVVLIEGGDRVLGSFVPRLSAAAERQLERLGVEVMTGTRVVGIDAGGVDWQRPAAAGGAPSSGRIAARTVVWAAGVAGVPLGRELARVTGASVDRGGRVTVAPDLSLPGHPDVFVVGDLAAAMSHPRSGHEPPTPVPGVSPAAKQMGRAAAANVLARCARRPTRAFHYRDYGSLATIGRKAAVVDLPVPGLGHLRFWGFPAWLFWLFAHVWFLIGFRNRLIVLMDWAWAYFTYQRNARVVPEAAGEGGGDPDGAAPAVTAGSPAKG